jgi:hypothetical protein
MFSNPRDIKMFVGMTTRKGSQVSDLLKVKFLLKLSLGLSEARVIV